MSYPSPEKQREMLRQILSGGYIPAIVITEDSAIEYLRARGLAEAETQCTTEPAGDGNINWVRRIQANDGRSWIIKQAREQLEKFPQYRADTRRILVEAAWLQQAASVDHDACCPEIIDFDPDLRVLVLEDLGLCPRLDQELLTERNLAAPLETIGGLLGRLHRKTSHDASLAATFRSTNMRELHFAHIFELPFSENDFPLPEPVRELSVERDKVARAAHRGLLGRRHVRRVVQVAIGRHQRQHGPGLGPKQALVQS